MACGFLKTTSGDIKGYIENMPFPEEGGAVAVSAATRCFTAETQRVDFVSLVLHVCITVLTLYRPEHISL